MTIQYRKFLLSPGQNPPKGSTGIALRDGWVVWPVETETFTDADMDATFGYRTATDIEPKPKIENYIMTQEEIDEYLNPTVSGKENEWEER